MHATYRSKPSQARNLISGIETNVCSAERRINSTCDAIANIMRPNTMTNIAIFRSRIFLLRCLGYFHHEPEVGLTKTGELWDFRRFRHNGNSWGWPIRLKVTHILKTYERIEQWRSSRKRYQFVGKLVWGKKLHSAFWWVGQAKQMRTLANLGRRQCATTGKT